jgi:phosphate uptake regulator
LTPAEAGGQTNSKVEIAMNAYTSADDSFSRRVEEWVRNADAEIRHAAAYVDRVIVPEVRHELGGAARVLAGHLERIADRLDPQPPASRPDSDSGWKRGQ